MNKLNKNKKINYLKFSPNILTRLTTLNIKNFLKKL
jgi:hypothetical protein